VTGQLSELEDQDLASLAIGGNQTACCELVRRHRDWVYRLVRAQIGDADESLDVTQGAFIAAFGALDRFDRARPFKLWLARIALNKCKDWRRRALVRRFMLAAAPLTEAEEVADPAPGADITASDRSELKVTLKAISNCPLHCANPSSSGPLMRTQAETAQILGLSEKAVEARVYRARARLTDKLKKFEGLSNGLRIQ
jgi:RNA polymerase sigma-70 factor (ECF subfamily)